MDRRPGHPDASLDGLALRVETAERGEQRRMHVENRRRNTIEKLRSEEAHETTKGDQIDPIVPDDLEERLLRFRPEVGAFRRRGQHLRRHAKRADLFKDCRVRPIAHDANDFPGDSAVARGLDQVDRVGPPTGSQNEQPQQLHLPTYTIGRGPSQGDCPEGVTAGRGSQRTYPGAGWARVDTQAPCGTKVRRIAPSWSVLK